MLLVGGRDRRGPPWSAVQGWLEGRWPRLRRSEREPPGDPAQQHSGFRLSGSHLAVAATAIWAATGLRHRTEKNPHQSVNFP